MRNFKYLVIFRIFLIIGGLAMIVDGISWVVTMGFYSKSLCLRLAKIRTDWQLRELKRRRSKPA